MYMNPKASTHDTGSFTEDIVSCNAQTMDGSNVNKTRHEQESGPNSRRSGEDRNGNYREKPSAAFPSPIIVARDLGRSFLSAVVDVGLQASGLSSRAVRPLDVFVLTRIGGERISMITKEP